jgi:transposase
VLDALFEWLMGQQGQVLPKSPMAVAIGYALANRSACTRYTEAGFLAIDNYASERALRAVAIGRKHYLFTGSDAGAESAAVLYSVVATYRRLAVDPFALLRDTFARLPVTPAERLDDLLPDR